MNRFLKKEWHDAEIPEQVYVQARNRAWAEIQAGPSQRRVKIAYALAAGAALLLLVCVSVSRRDIQDRDQQGARTAAVRPQPTSDALRAGVDVPGGAVAGRTKPAAKAMPLAKIYSRDTRRVRTIHASLRQKRHDVVAARDTSGKTESPERIVLNFQLPTSGVRMIWILDRTFHLDGGTE
ncbi:MAG TPA: hypothetical protein VGQ81_11410 [Acidobacteriota bacterium]|jgi:hypothetical protein|nr:hypothetical protein [Acidobacteriota bacterium]